MTTALKVLNTKELAKVGNRSISLQGFTCDLAFLHLEEHVRQRPMMEWCTVNCMARTMYGRDTAANREKIRRNGSRMFRSFISRHAAFLVIAYGSAKDRGKIVGFRLFQAKGSDHDYAQHQLERMRDRQQVSQELAEKAAQIIQRL